MFQKKALMAVLATALIGATVYAKENAKVDCDAQFEACIEKCETGGDENCERSCDAAYEACLAAEQSEEQED